jgi:hypothetical protein
MPTVSTRSSRSTRGADAGAGERRDEPAGGDHRADARDGEQAEAGEQAGAVRRGGTLVTVRADDTHADRVYSILKEHGSIDMDDRATTVRAVGAAPAANGMPPVLRPVVVLPAAPTADEPPATVAGRERGLGLEDELPPARQPLGTERR